MLRLLVGLVIVALVGCFAAPAVAAPPPPTDEQEAVKKVNKAIELGVQYLRVNQKPNEKHWDGFWLNQIAGMDGGVSALAVLALLNCGVNPDDKDIKSALEYLRKIPPSRTYVVGLSTMVFAEARQPRDLPLIQRNVDWLLANSSKQGGKIIGWSYPFDQTQTAADASNTQYALLGLYAGKQAGAKIPDQAWKEIREMYISSIKKDGPDSGYWAYVEQRPLASFPMTVAGVCGLLIADMGLNESQQKLDPNTGIAANCGKYDANDPLYRGLNYIGKNFALLSAKDSKSDFYNIYGIERAGRLSGQRFLGRSDWYREGCDYLTGKPENGGQLRDGSWVARKGIDVDATNVLSTSFALLFLSKGRSPVLISKLAYGEASFNGGVLDEKHEEPNVIGWNRKHSDARHLTEFSSRELFNGLPMGWQVYDPRRKEFNKNEDLLAEVGVLVQTPILYLNGHQKPKLPAGHKEIVKRYIEEGGFLLAEACCGSPEFTAGFKELIAELFPDSKLIPVPPEHAVWRSHYAIPPTEFPNLMCLERGCKTVVIFSPQPVAGFWEESKYMPAKGKPDGKGEMAFRLGANVIAYATGKEPPKQRLTTTRIVDTKKDLSPPKGFLKPAQIRIPGEAAPAPAAMRNLMAHLKAAARIDAVLDKETISPGQDELFKFKFVYMHGRKRFAFDDAEVQNVKANLQGGGLLFADACCGKPEFDAAFRELIAKMYPDRKLEPIPVDDELYSAKLNGKEITSVKRREKATSGEGTAGDGFRDLPPALEGLKIDGRWVVIYSKYDIGCALENHKSSDCLGHDRDGALALGTAAVLYALKR